LLEHLSDYEFYDSGNGLGAVYIGNFELAEIIEVDYKVGVRIKHDGCALLDDNGLCKVHDKVLMPGSILAENFKIIGLDNAVKPFTCRAYPYEYDYDSGRVIKNINCSDELEDRIIEVPGHTKLARQAKKRKKLNDITCNILAKTWGGEGRNPIMDIIYVLREYRLPKAWPKYLFDKVLERVGAKTF